ncbi:MAG TPA: prolipoprotein diacylglyceryl transferase family protein, partial [Gemmataceae bacterium]|nr:prolipoprotein diacylglyceryl transferase family protein [Gemmataceae bacterium]
EIVGVNDFDLRLDDMLQEALRDGRPGDKSGKKTMMLTVLRAGHSDQIGPFAIVDLGPRTTTGFTIDPNYARIVAWVGPDSEAAKAGLQRGDKIIGVNGRSLETWEGSAFPFHEAFRTNWPRGKNDLSLIVVRDGREIDIGPFTHQTVPLHPTQIYESISMILLVFLLVSIFPYNRYDGLIMVIFMVGYAVHRFLNESLRNDTDPVAFGMTLSQNVSIVLLIGAAILGVAVWRHHVSKKAPIAFPNS